MTNVKTLQKFLFAATMLLSLWAKGEEKRTLTVKMRGVYESKITLSPFNGVRVSHPIAVEKGVKNGDQVIFTLPDSLLPGEFLVRFDYKAKETDFPYPSELRLYLNKENIKANVRPQYLHGDSLILKGDRENKIWNQFVTENSKKRLQINLLTQLLQGYDRPDSKEWVQAAEAFGKRTKAYNKWIDSMSIAYEDLYVGHLFSFQHLQKIDWSKTTEEQYHEQAASWFDQFDFDDALVLRSRQMNEYLNGFVGLFGQRATTEELRDSLFTAAGSLACEKASTGNPMVYGWIVDYFFNGYETYNITEGLKMLEKHINNPNCLTSKKMEIVRRLEGLKKLVPGVPAPILNVQNIERKDVEIKPGKDGKEYQLLVFYASDCGHCEELFSKLKKWYDVPENEAWFSITTIALDDVRETWEKSHNTKSVPWTDMYAPEGVNSEAASNYYVLSTPSLFVVDKKGDLVAFPGSVHELDTFLNGDD